MKKGFIGIFVLFGIAFLAIALLKQNSETDPDGKGYGVTISEDSSRAEVIDFWDSYERATDLRIAGDHNRALAFYQKALSIDPEHQNSLYYRGNLLLRSGKFKEARESWEKLKQVNPSSARAYSQLGTLYSCRDPENPLYDLGRAADQFEEAARLNREETGPLLQLAKIDLVNHDYGRAGQKLDDVISSNFRSAEALFLKGFLEWRDGGQQPADSLFRRSLSIVKGTTSEKNVGEGETENDRSPVWADLSRCNLYSERIYRLLYQADPAQYNTTDMYRSFENESH